MERNLQIHKLFSTKIGRFPLKANRPLKIRGFNLSQLALTNRHQPAYNMVIQEYSVLDYFQNQHRYEFP